MTVSWPRKLIGPDHNLSLLSCLYYHLHIRNWNHSGEGYFKRWGVFQAVRGLSSGERYFKRWGVFQAVRGISSGEGYFKRWEVFQAVRGISTGEGYFNRWGVFQAVRGISSIWVMVIVLNAIFNNISVISWRSVLLL
jgi:hypothetical protein